MKKELKYYQEICRNCERALSLVPKNELKKLRKKNRLDEIIYFTKKKNKTVVSFTDTSEEYREFNFVVDVNYTGFEARLDSSKETIQFVPNVEKEEWVAGLFTRERISKLFGKGLVEYEKYNFFTVKVKELV